MEKAIKRMDDLHKAEQDRVNEIIKLERERVNGLIALRAEHSIQLEVAEAKRIDAIRAVDVNAVGVANERATAQAAVLANQVSASAETLRALVASTAATTAQQLTQLTTQLTDRLTLLEKASYENKGTSGGMRDMYGWVFGIAMALLSVAGLIYTMMKK